MILEEIFDILKIFNKGDDQINLNIVLNEYLPYRVFAIKRLISKQIISLKQIFLLIKYF